MRPPARLHREAAKGAAYLLAIVAVWALVVYGAVLLGEWLVNTAP